jgi:hypothetical protein
MEPGAGDAVLPLENGGKIMTGRAEQKTDTRATRTDTRHYVDPAEEAMSRNPNLSPPIEVHADENAGSRQQGGRQPKPLTEKGR